MELLAEGHAAVLNARMTSDRRMAAGLERARFVNAIFLGGVLTWIGMYVSELSGVSAAMDRSMGDEPSWLFLTWPMFGSSVIALSVVTALILWKGPAVASRLSRLVGGQSGAMDAAIWIYLSTLASGVIALAVIALDLAFGLLLQILPDATGWVPLIIAFVSLFATLVISAHLAENVLAIGGRVRSLLFTCLWLALMLLVVIAVWAPLYAAFGGGEI
jgi:hypothetical protein